MSSGLADSSDVLHNGRPALASALCHDPLSIGGIAVGLLLGTYGLLGLSIDFPLLLAGVSGSTLVYLAERVWMRPPEDRMNHPERVAWIRAHSTWLGGETVVLLAAGAVAFFYLEVQTVLLCGILAGLAGLHILPRSGKVHEGGLWKPIAIAGAWAVGAVLLPVVEAGEEVEVTVMLFCLYRFLFVLPNLLLADWSDREGDAEMGLHPWAVQWTRAHVQGVASFLLLGALIAAGGWTLTGASSLLMGIDVVGVLLMVGVVWGLDLRTPLHALLADLVVAWPVVTFFVAWMIV